jgi:PAS domain S-box-containing protein
MTLHKTLERQIKKVYGTDAPVLDDATKKLLELVSAAYAHADEDIKLTQHSLALVSQEMRSANERLQSEVKALTESRAHVTDLEALRSAMINVLEDLQEEKTRAEKQAIETEKFKRAVDATQSGIVITKKDFTIIYANEALQTLTGYTAQELIGKTPALFHSGKTPEAVYKALTAAIHERQVFSSEDFINKRKDGHEYQASLSVYPIMNGEEVEFFVGVQSDVTERKRAERAKTEFVSIAGHQLRTPLTAMRWYLEALLKKPKTMHIGQIEKLSEVHRSTIRLIGLVNAMLDASRLETGSIMQNKEKIDVALMMKEVIKEHRVLAEQGRITMTDQIDAVSGYLYADPKLFRMIPENLISNALKYTPAGQTVSVRLSQSPEVFGGTPTAPGITLVVQDSGIGIPKEQHHRVFEKMFRADNARHAEAVGTGLGLYTIKIAVETLGGKIWFESQENIGTTFYVYLPTTDASMPEKGV